MVVTHEGKLPAWREGETDAFGELLYALMRKNDIRNPSELSKAMAGTEQTFSRQTIVNYMTGETSVSVAFVAAVARLLKLTKREKARLAYMACYGEEF